MSDFELKYKPFGERSILIEWPQIISKDVHKSVLSFKSKLKKESFKDKVHIKLAYCSILITYASTIRNIYDEILTLKDIYSSNSDDLIFDSKLWKIPVCYDVEFGLDLEEMSNKSSINISDIIALHSNTIYDVFFIGFLPGFLYLGGLDSKLHFPRKNTPRLKIETGSVAIGGSQTGIYPTQSPGGWNIIGRTPINFFNIKQEIPCFAKAGDKIQFISVLKSDFYQILDKVNNSTYIIESEVIYD